MSKYTKPPWQVITGAYPVKEINTIVRQNTSRRCICTIHMPECNKSKENANLIATAPSMDMLLSLLATGEAHLEHSKTSNLVEFCWKGLRYACSDCDWARLVKTIGYDKIESAITKNK